MKRDCFDMFGVVESSECEWGDENTFFDGVYVQDFVLDERESVSKMGCGKFEWDFIIFAECYEWMCLTNECWICSDGKVSREKGILGW